MADGRGECLTTGLTRDAGRILCTTELEGAITIPAEEAASALKDAEAAAGRAEAARGYHLASGYLILWGVVWVAGNVASQVSERVGITAWNVGVLIGVVGSFVMGARQRGVRARGGGVKALLVALAIGGFGMSSAAIAPGLSFMQFSALACLAVGAIYLAMGAGAGGGLRLSAVGAAIMAATLIGWFFAREQFFLWMAVAGGGGLILGGLWFRKV